jgi:hypothetical protein
VSKPKAESADEDVWLPGYRDGGTPVPSVHASFTAMLDGAAAGSAPASLSLYYFSASVAGWRLLAPAIKKWRAGGAGRVVSAYVGTDFGLTDPAALAEMRQDGVSLFLMTDYEGTYHPKVILLRDGDGAGTAWIGSHNLSEAAFKRNAEFGVRLSFATSPDPLEAWIEFVEGASEAATPDLIQSYEKERNAFAKKQAAVPRFVWSKRKKPTAAKPVVPPAPKGALVMEIMPRETGQGGKQIQPPMATLPTFFGLAAGQSSKLISARLKGAPAPHDLTLTRLPNSTARLHIAELDYTHRPCFIVFERNPSGFTYEIVTQAAEPARYHRLSGLKFQQWQPGTRRWTYA